MVSFYSRTAAWVPLLLFGVVIGAVSMTGLEAQAARKRKASSGRSKRRPATIATPPASAPLAPAAAPAPIPAASPAPGEDAGPPPAPRAEPSGSDFDEGLALYKRGDYAAAITRFQAGYDKSPDPVFLYNIAQAHRQAHHDDLALAFYRRYLAAEPNADNRAEVEAQITALSPPDPVQEAHARAFAMAKEGRTLTREKDFTAGLAKLKAAVELGEEARLPDEDQAELRYAYGKGLARAREESQALEQLTRALALRPGDASILADTAQLRFQGDDYDGAIRDARAALRLGLDADDAEETRGLLREAERERLRERLSVDGSLTYGFDSNVLQGSVGGRETIGRVFVGSANTRLKNARQVQGNSAAATFFSNPREAPSAWNLPLTLRLGVEGRLLGNRKHALLAGYRFGQYLLTVPSGDQDYDADAYALQDHYAGLRFQSQPASWLRLALRAEGTASFSGLAAFTPYLAGYSAGLDVTFRESRRWQTRLTAQNQGRWAMDRSVPTTSTSDCSYTLANGTTVKRAEPDQPVSAYLDGNRSDAGLAQIMRLALLQARLGYRLSYDRSGTLSQDVPVLIVDAGKTDPRCFVYTSTFSYLGNQVFARANFHLPWKLELNLNASFEHRSYLTPYSVAPAATPKQTIPFDRRDLLLITDISLARELPRGFEVELGYGFTYNNSTIANYADNRNYTKHLVTVAGSYSF